LTDEQVDNALKDLDLNNDGVIDLDEFSRWYFTGMKPYNDTTRTMLKVRNHSASLFNTMADKVKQAYAGDLKTKSHKLSLCLNTEQGFGTEVDVAAYVAGGISYNRIKAQLNQYSGTFDFEKARELH